MKSLFLLYLIALGLGVPATLLYAGYASWPAIPSLALGALVQVLFRFSKKIWANSLVPAASADPEPSLHPGQRVKIMLLIYLLMLAVSAFWYFCGRGLALLAG